MTLEIFLVLAILILVIVLLVTDWVPLEVIALLVLGILAITKIVSPLDALSGFSNPAVVTIWAVFILSGGLTRTGVANILGRQLLRVAGSRPSLMVVTIMVIGGGLSAFMNNVAVAALMLPVVMDIAKKTDCSPSTLLMPLAYGSLLGGLTTMIGTPPNILVSEALRENGLTPFTLFDFSPIGLVVMTVGVAFVTLIGTRMLPSQVPGGGRETGSPRDFRTRYGLSEKLFRIRIPSGSTFVGKTLAQSRLGAGFGLTVLGMVRGRTTLSAPEKTETIQEEDILIVKGQADRIAEMKHWSQLAIDEGAVDLDRFFSSEMTLAALSLNPDSDLTGKGLVDIGFRSRFGLNVLAIVREGRLIKEDLIFQPLAKEDRLIVYGPGRRLASLADHPDLMTAAPLSLDALKGQYPVLERFRCLKVPERSGLVGMTLSESRLGDSADVQILGILRADGTMLLPSSRDRFEARDQLLVSGSVDMISIFLKTGIQDVLIVDEPTGTDPAMLEDDHTGFVEVMLSPHTVLSGMTLRQIQFREKYGLTVTAILRKGKVHRSGLRDMPLDFGDALLLFGQWEKIRLLGRESDFLVLTETAQEQMREDKVKVALAVMAAVLLPVMAGWVPIYISAVMGAAVMVLTGCLTMEEAYRHIEWKAVFLIAGMMPLGTALDQSGAAHLLAEGLVGVLGPFGPYAALFGLLAITFAATSIIPTAALVVLMVPIALKTSAGLGISPYPLMMGIAMAASSSFTSPISHPANVLVMGPGGYRFMDYVKVGVPLTLVIFAVLMLLLPVFWPF